MPAAPSRRQLPLASAKSGHTLYASSLIKSMLRSSYLPHVKAWSAVVPRLSTEPLSESINFFDSVTLRVRRFADPSIVADSKLTRLAIMLCLTLLLIWGTKYTLYGGVRITTFERNIGSGASGMLDDSRTSFLPSAL
ncbi:hypothetical protein ES332_A07G008300v1 [Gossypium tomentosum]|uniref:Uncharacterized protein n=1 Tax=Gossypium tomentosum TaxID=34277 RepID=A0A5D2PML7_GOSTO|nr:hypothetical protein ES332_A07G008300v1 [Gossypium tomentosum]